MNVNIPTAMLRTFSSVVENGSMNSAARQVFLSQSAVSFQIRKLESLISHPLFYRDGRGLILTASGEMLYEYAKKILRLHDEAIGAIDSNGMSRPVKVGIVQDFSESFLKEMLVLQSSSYPSVQLYIKVSRTNSLKRLISEGELDIAIGFSEINDSASVQTKPTLWFGRPELLDSPAVPLALLEHPCRFRDAALAALEQAGRPYRIALEAPNLSALRAAVDAGIGLTCRTSLFGDGSCPPINGQLPELPHVGVSMYQSSNNFPAAAHFLKVAHAAIQGI